MTKCSFEYPEGFFSNYHSQKPICGVLAVAIAAEVTYDVAAEHCKETMKICHPNRQRFGGKTTTAQRELAMQRLGVKFERTNIDSKKPKLIDLVKTFEPGVLYQVVTPKHISCVKDGYLIDQGRLQRIELVSFARKHVREFTKIIGKGW